MSGKTRGDALAELTGVMAIEEEARLAARELAAKSHAAKTAGNGPGWVTGRVQPGAKLPPDLWAVEQPDGAYSALGRSRKWHVLFGGSGSAKTFTAAGLAAWHLRRQQGVYWADFEDQADDLPDMLRAFGVHDLADLHLYQPEAPPDAAEIVSYCGEHGIGLVVMDAQRGAISNAVPGERDNGRAVELYHVGLVRPMTRAGLTVITIDHVAKSGSGGMPIDSERKFSAADVMFEVEAAAEIAEGVKLGHSSLTVRKYRGGAFRKGDVPANLVYEDGRATIRAEVVPPSLAAFVNQRQNGTVNRDLERAFAVAEYVGLHQDELPNQSQLAEGLMSWQPDLFPSDTRTRAAIRFARDTGRITEKTGGAGKAKTYELATERAPLDPSQPQPAEV